MCMQAHTHLPATKLDSKYKHKNNTTQTEQKWQMLMKNTTFITYNATQHVLDRKSASLCHKTDVPARMWNTVTGAQSVRKQVLEVTTSGHGTASVQPHNHNLCLPNGAE